MRVTMAVELLRRSVSVENVAAILGNTPLIVQKHYVPFVQARQLILENKCARLNDGCCYIRTHLVEVGVVSFLILAAAPGDFCNHGGQETTNLSQ